VKDPEINGLPPDILLVTIGTLGDVIPFIVVGRYLSERGLRVSVATHEHYRTKVESFGLVFKPLTAEGDLQQFVSHVDAWDPSRGAAVAVDKLIVPMLEPVYNLVEREAVGRKVLVLAHPHAFGARVVQDQHDILLWTLYPSAWLFQSVYTSQVYPRAKVALIGNAGRYRLFKRFIDWVIDKLLGEAALSPIVVIGLSQPMWLRRLARYLFTAWSDAMLAKPVNKLRHGYGLPPVKRILVDWCHSPQRVVGLFTPWYANPQSDWPPPHLLVGFAEGPSDLPVPEKLQVFLEGGERPVVFTFGSEKRSNSSVFAQGLEACRRLGLRAVFISPDIADLPAELPASVFHGSYAPFDYLFDHAACVVHHAGMGTAAAAMRAGVPQLLVPFTYDQPDNAARLRRIGVAEVLAPRAFDSENLAEMIKRLTGSEITRDNCAHVKRLMLEGPKLDLLVDEIMELGKL